MVEINDWEARLVLLIMNTAAEHYPKHVRNSRIMDDIKYLGEYLESRVGPVRQKVGE